MNTLAPPLLEVDGITVRLPVGAAMRTVLHDVSISIAAGEALGLVGESGSGKSMTARSIARLLPRGAESSGQIRFDGGDIGRLRGARLARVPERGRRGVPGPAGRTSIRSAGSETS